MNIEIPNNTPLTNINRLLTNNEEAALKKVVNALTKELTKNIISGKINIYELLNELENTTSGGAKKPKSKKSPAKKPKSKKSPAKKLKSKKSPAKKPKRKSLTKK